MLALRTGASKRWGRHWRCGSLDFMSNVATPVVYQLKVRLRGISPMNWRRLLVQADMTLYALHCEIQIAFGWDDCHLNAFNPTGGATRRQLLILPC